MPAFDVVIRNAKVVTRSFITETEVYISEGIIKRLGYYESRPRADLIIDASGLVILPGLVDTHVHFRDPGMTHKEDFETGSRGAAAGGTTTVCDMPTTFPVVTNRRIFREKLNEVKKKSVVDFALYSAASVDNLRELEGVAEEGAIAFKTYTVSPPKERVKEYEGAFVTEFGQLLAVMEKSSQLGLLHCIHAEDDSSVKYFTDKLKSAGRRDPHAHCEARPNLAEKIAVYQAIAAAEYSGARLHLLHISTREAVEMIRAAKGRGVKVTAETCPHYLYFTERDMERLGSYGKFNPPARTDEDVKALWEAVRDGVIDAIVSDHAPHSREEKDEGREDIWKAPPGTPGVETKLPAILSKAAGWGLELQDVVRLCSTSPAAIFGVGSRKGEIREGMDADLVVLDPCERWRLDPSELQTKAKDTVIFAGMEMKGRIRYTLLRGKVVYERGVGFEKPGIGAFIAGGRAKERAITAK